MTEEDLLAHLESLAHDRGYLHLMARVARERDAATVGALSLSNGDTDRRDALGRHHALSWVLDLHEKMIAEIRASIGKANREE